MTFVLAAMINLVLWNRGPCGIINLFGLWEGKNKKPARDQTDWSVFFEKRTHAFGRKRNRRVLGYGLLYRVRRSFRVFSSDLDSLAFGRIGLVSFGYGWFFSDLDSNVVCL